MVPIYQHSVFPPGLLRSQIDLNRLTEVGREDGVATDFAQSLVSATCYFTITLDCRSATTWPERAILIARCHVPAIEKEAMP